MTLGTNVLFSIAANNAQGDAVCHNRHAGKKSIQITMFHEAYAHMLTYRISLFMANERNTVT